MKTLEKNARAAQNRDDKYAVAVDELTTVLIHNLRKLPWSRGRDKTNQAIHRLQTEVERR